MGVTDLKSETLTNADIAHRTELIRLAGWRNPIITTTGPCSVGKLLVPDRGLELSATIYDRQPISRVMNRVYDIVAIASVTEAMAPRPIYLARPLGHRRETPNEQDRPAAGRKGVEERPFLGSAGRACRTARPTPA